MISQKSKSFNSKILLFGEYSLMKGSMALSIPYEKFKGQLLFNSDKKEGHKDHLSIKYLIDYLKYLQDNHFDDFLNLTQFKTDIENGLFFECNIPISYGLGSSGAIVAAIYSVYAYDKETELEELKLIFSKMESYYHGKSSGLDPLVSYLNNAIIVSEEGKISVSDSPKPVSRKKGGIFLIDTNCIGETQPLVKWFLHELEDEQYENKIKSQLIPLNSKCINDFLSSNYNSLLSNFKSISQFTYDNFKPMIPSTIENIWKNGLINENYFLKLCGSGGGGMMLGITNNIDETFTELNEFKTHLLYSF